MAKEVLFLDVSQRRHLFTSQCKSLAKNLDLQCVVEYMGMRFGFPFNTMEYMVSLSGDESNIMNFKRLVDQIS